MISPCYCSDENKIIGNGQIKDGQQSSIDQYYNWISKNVLRGRAAKNISTT